MSIYYQDESVQLWHGDCLDILATLPDNSVHAVCTDPPYGLEFMGKSWDSFKGANDWGRLGDTAPWKERPKGGTDPFQGDRPRFHAGKPFQDWCELWTAECLRVLKPGGHLLAFGGSRTWHRLAVAVEDAGFEIRDSIAWLHSQGFPKSMNPGRDQRFCQGCEVEYEHEVGSGEPHQPRPAGQSAGEPGAVPQQRGSQAWRGWPVCARCGKPSIPDGLGTALKPAFEPIVVARKPFTGTVAGNVLEHGTGALNIDGCRIATEDNLNGGGYSDTTTTGSFLLGGAGSVDELRALAAAGEKTPNGETATLVLARAETAKERVGEYVQPSGRWPTNVLLDDTQAAELDRQSGEARSSVRAATTTDHKREDSYTPDRGNGQERGYVDSGGASRFFPTFRYEAKAPTEERPRVNGVAHPTVKPLDLMRWLVRLVTPPGGTVLDPFAGSGTTAEACVIEGFQHIAIEREADYLPLIKARLTKPLEPVLDLGALS